MRYAAIFLAIVSSAVAVPVLAAPIASQQCQAALEMASARSSQCRLTAAARFAKNNDASKRDSALAHCSTSFSESFAKAVSKFGSSNCSSVAAKAFDRRLTRCSHDIVAASALGGTLPPRNGVGLLATGQVTCWDSNGVQISCSGTGQDGDLRRGVPAAYVDNGDGTISDLVTGLMWEKMSMLDGSVHDVVNKYTWDEAYAVKLAALNAGGGFAGYTDWRLPNRRELESLVDLERDNYPAVGAAFNNNCPLSTVPCTIQACSCTSSGSNWTSSTARVQGQEDSAWAVFFYNGSVVTDTKSTSFVVRAVRGGS